MSFLFRIRSSTTIRDSVLGSRETFCCLALAMLLAISGCQAPGISAWNWGPKPAPPSTANGSPISAAASGNHSNTSDIGPTVNCGPAGSKPASPPANLPGALPSPSAVGPAIPGAAYPPGSPTYGNAGPNAVPGGGAPPGMGGAAPMGYWVYQPANGYPAMNQNGAPLCIPVYGPPMNGNYRYGPAPLGGNPPAPCNMAVNPVQTSAFPENCPPATQPNAPVNAPAMGSTPMPPYGAGGQSANSPGCFAPAS